MYVAAEPSGHPILILDGNATQLAPIQHDPSTRTEQYLQSLLDEHPELLPIAEIGSAWGPLVSLGCEIAVSVGLIDNLFVSPTGEVTVAEAKLWRNPEARRKVVGQILDYAAQLSRLSYEDLDQTVRASTGDDRSMWQRVLASPHAPDPAGEAAFVDRITQNLRTGRFLLLVVGDGIRSDLHALSDLLSGHPTLGFQLELIELKIFSLPDGGRLVVPARVSRTETVQRTIIEIRNPDSAVVAVEVVSDHDAISGPGNRYSSLDQFLADLAEGVGESRARAAEGLITWWHAERHGLVTLNITSVKLSSPYQHTPGGSIAVLTIYNDGRCEGQVAPMAKWRGIITPEDALAQYEAAGFGGHAEWPSLDLDLTRSDQRARVMELMVWADELIRAASAGPAPLLEQTDPRA